MKIFLRILGILIGIIVIFIAFQFMRISSMRKFQHPAATGKITVGLYAVNAGIVNFYVYSDGINTICVDSGLDAKLNTGEMKKIGVNPESVKAVLLTHTDYDHTGGIHAFPNAAIYISQDEEQMVNGKTARFFGLMHNRLDKKYTLLKDGEKIEIGTVKITALSTPGHTPGSMSYLIDNKYLFTGDTLRLQDGIATNFVEFINMDTPMEIKSIKKLAKLDNIGVLLTGHSGYTTNFTGAMKNYR